MKILALLLAICTSCPAATVHVLPEATGTGDGSSWEHAQGATALAELLGGGLAAGDTLRLGSGAYAGTPYAVRLVGTAEQPIVIEGIDTGEGLPTITSTWTREQPASGAHGLVFEPGCAQVVVRHLRFRDCHHAIYARAGGLAHLTWEDLEIARVRSGFHLIGWAPDQERSHDLAIRRCRMIGYTKRGVRLEGGNQRVVVEDCVADSGGGEWAVEPFPMSYHVIGDRKAKEQGREPLHEDDIAFIRCEGRNNHHYAGEKYWNADGFAAEGGCTRIRYIDCVASGNTDGGWDDKSVSPVLIRCRAFANKRNFRFWTSVGQAVLIDCISQDSHKAGGSGAACGLWYCGSVLLLRCQITDAREFEASGDRAWLVRAE